MNKETRRRVQESYIKYNKDKYPNVPEYAIPIFKRTDNGANALTRLICDFLTWEGWQAERISNTGRMIDNRKKVTDVNNVTKIIGSVEWIKGTGTNGTADISATIMGRSVKIEVKYGKDRQSEVQKKYQRKIEAAGGMYCIAKNMEGFLDWYDSFMQRITPQTIF